MKILALDTATKTCSVAILEDGHLVCEHTSNHGGTHTRFVMSIIHHVLESSKISMKFIDGFAVTKGPGSFTGLRIGLSIIKGFAMALDKPVVGVSSLDALAIPLKSKRLLVCPMLDAKKGEVYTACYAMRKNGFVMIEGQRVMRPEIAIEGIEVPCIFAGDGVKAYQHIISERMGQLALFPSDPKHQIRAYSVGCIAAERFVHNDTDSVSHLVPAYIRKSDAELKFKKKPGFRL